MSNHHFTPYERGKIEELHRIGYTSRKTAMRLECHHSSIAREIKRFSSEQGYNSRIARRKGRTADPHGK